MYCFCFLVARRLTRAGAGGMRAGIVLFGVPLEESWLGDAVRLERNAARSGVCRFLLHSVDAHLLR